MKRITTISICAIVIMFCVVQAVQAVGVEAGFPDVKFTVGSNTYEKGGEAFTMDAAPFIENGRTFVPVAFLAKAIDAEIKWDPALQKVELKANMSSTKPVVDYCMAMYISQNYVESWGIVDGTPNKIRRQNIDVAPVIRDGRTYLPAAYVVKNFHRNATWNSNDQTITIQTNREGGL